MFQPIQTSRDLFLNVFRVLLLGLVVGAASSMAALAMIYLIAEGSQWLTVNKNGFPFITASILTVVIPAIGGLIVGHIVPYIKEQRPQSPADAILATQSKLKLATLNIKDGLLNYLASIISLVSGASLGQYGPIVNMGATLGANCYRFIKVEHTILIGCGVAAAISSAFNAPIAGVIFAHEVIIRHYSLRAFAPITIAASVGFYLSKFVFYSQPLFELQFIEVLYLGEFFGFMLVGIFSGLLAVIFLRAILYARLLSNKIPTRQAFKPMFAGLLIGLMALQIPEILGIGADTLRQTLVPDSLQALDLSILLIAKIAAAALCLGFGFAGGVFSPALLIGVLFGALFGMGVDLFFPHSSLAVYAVCGMAAVTSPIIGAPLTTIIIIFELTRSYELTTAVMISVVFSNVVSSQLFGRSLYDFQLKSRGYDLSHGRDPLILGTMPVVDISRPASRVILAETSVKEAMDQLVSSDRNEGFVLDAAQCFVGSISLSDLMRHKDSPHIAIAKIEDLVNRHCLRFSPQTSIWEAMRDIKGFVGEHVPIVEPESQQLSGLIAEVDLIEAYMKTARALRDEETASV